MKGKICNKEINSSLLWVCLLSWKIELFYVSKCPKSTSSTQLQNVAILKFISSETETFF